MYHVKRVIGNQVGKIVFVVYSCRAFQYDLFFHHLRVILFDSCSTHCFPPVPSNDPILEEHDDKLVPCLCGSLDLTLLRID